VGRCWLEAEPIDRERGAEEGAQANILADAQQFVAAESW